MTLRKYFRTQSFCLLMGNREKARIPAWCDRVLFKGNTLRQTAYDTVPLKFSDHRPVFATFECTVNVINEKKRQGLSRDLHASRRATISRSKAASGGNESSEKNAFSHESISSRLPPSSSERRKWWLDNGITSYSTYHQAMLIGLLFRFSGRINYCKQLFEPQAQSRSGIQSFQA